MVLYIFLDFFEKQSPICHLVHVDIESCTLLIALEEIPKIERARITHGHLVDTTDRVLSSRVESFVTEPLVENCTPSTQYS
jgi:hypothetical protein